MAAVGVLGARAGMRRQSSFDETPQTLAGDTLDIDPASPPEPAVREEAEKAESPLAPVAPVAPAALAERGPRGPEPPLAGPRVLGTTAAAADAPSPALFGAVGVRFAVDLATTFTRMFPQAASADPAWREAGLGSAGTADVTLVLDETGRIVSETVDGAPSRALREGIARTIAGLRARAFTARAAVTHLRVSARVQRDDVHDGLHGDVFALSGGSFRGDTGAAFFALPGPGGGRRVDVELRVLTR